MTSETRVTLTASMAGPSTDEDYLLWPPPRSNYVDANFYNPLTAPTDSFNVIFNVCPYCDSVRTCGPNYCEQNKMAYSLSCDSNSSSDPENYRLVNKARKPRITPLQEIIKRGI